MVESAEMELLRRDTSGLVHDFMKYLNPFEWEIELSKCKSIKDERLSAAKKAFDSVNTDLRVICGMVFDAKDTPSKLRARAESLEANVRQFERQLVSFGRSKKCPKQLAKKIRENMPSFRMLVPLARIFGQGRPKLARRWIRVRPLARQLQLHLRHLEELTRLDALVKRKKMVFPKKVTFQVQGNPLVLADKQHLQRALFNVFHDAVTHSRGEPVVVKLRLGREGLVFETVNLGRRIAPKVIKLIGNKPYSENVEASLPHGYGKIAAKDAIKAHGGRFQPENTPTGFRIKLTVPQKRKRRIA